MWPFHGSRNTCAPRCRQISSVPSRTSSFKTTTTSEAIPATLSRARPIRPASAPEMRQTERGRGLMIERSAQGTIQIQNALVRAFQNRPNDPLFIGSGYPGAAPASPAKRGGEDKKRKLPSDTRNPFNPLSLSANIQTLACLIPSPSVSLCLCGSISPSVVTHKGTPELRGGEFHHRDTEAQRTLTGIGSGGLRINSRFDIDTADLLGLRNQNALRSRHCRPSG